MAVLDEWRITCQLLLQSVQSCFCCVSLFDMAPEHREGVYSIGAVSKMLGVPTQTLRSWEERYGQIVPERSAGGQRLYSRDQVDQLAFIIAELDRGMQPADAHRLLTERDSLQIEARGDPASANIILLAERDPYAADMDEYFLRTEATAPASRPMPSPPAHCSKRSPRTWL